jgi:hypothetical protein
MTIYDIKDEYQKRYPEGCFFDEEMLKRYGESLRRMRLTGKGVVHSRGFGDVIAYEVLSQRESFTRTEDVRYYFDADTFEFVPVA